MHGSHEEIVARADLVIGKRCGISLGLAPARDRGEGQPDIGHLLDPLADAGEIGVGLDAARPVDIQRTRLVPIDAVGADDVVDEPALGIEPAHARRAAMSRTGGNPWLGRFMGVLRLGAAAAPKRPPRLGGPLSAGRTDTCQ